MNGAAVHVEDIVVENTFAGVVAGNISVEKGESTVVKDDGTVRGVCTGDLADILLAVGNGKTNAVVHNENGIIMNRLAARPADGLAVKTKVDVGGFVNGEQPLAGKLHIFCQVVVAACCDIEHIVDAYPFGRFVVPGAAVAIAFTAHTVNVIGSACRL